MRHGFIKVATAVHKVKVADCHYNAKQITEIIKEADKKGVEIIALPELAITSATCGDLYTQLLLLQQSLEALNDILTQSQQTNTIAVIGTPIAHKGRLLNCAAVIHRGRIEGIVAKSNYPAQSESGQERQFAPNDTTTDGETITICQQTTKLYSNHIFTTDSYTFAIEIGENMFSPIATGTQMALQGAEIIVSLGAVNELAGKHRTLVESYRNNSRRSISAFLFASSGFGESTGDLVFAGDAFICEAGELLVESKRFGTENQIIISEIDVELLRHRRMTSKAFCAARRLSGEKTATTHIPQKRSASAALTRTFNPHPFIPSAEHFDETCSDILSIQAAGLAKRLVHTNSDSCVIGISGGLDSTLALLVAVRAFDLLGKERTGIIGVTMPGFGTTDRTYTNALDLMKSLGITMREVPIREACEQHFKDIGHDISVHDVTYENSQARERTQILMDISNQTNGFVVGTGDLSELALGWATYNGDQMSMYGVNASVPKTLVQHLVRWAAANIVDEATGAILTDIVDTPISPELTPANEKGEIKQKTEDLVGPYELHDFFLYHFMTNGYTPQKIYYVAQHTFKERYHEETIKKWLTTFFRRFFTQQFKRSCMPDGPQVSSCSLSPRGGWQMPSDASSALWMAQCEKL